MWWLKQTWRKEMRFMMLEWESEPAGNLGFLYCDVQAGQAQKSMAVQRSGCIATNTSIFAWRIPCHLHSWLCYTMEHAAYSMRDQTRQTVVPVLGGAAQLSLHFEGLRKHAGLLQHQHRTTKQLGCLKIPYTSWISLHVGLPATMVTWKYRHVLHTSGIPYEAGQNTVLGILQVLQKSPRKP